jgi:hypothetical protein
MNKYLKSLAWLIILYGGLIFFLLHTNPNKLSISWLLVPFIWLFVALFYTFKLMINLLWLPPAGKHSKKQVSVAAICAAVPTLILILGSINQLTIKDILLLVALGFGGLFYIGKLRFIRRLN